MKIIVKLRFTNGTGAPLPETDLVVEAPKDAHYVSPEITIVQEAINASSETP